MGTFSPHGADPPSGASSSSQGERERAGRAALREAKLASTIEDLRKKVGRTGREGLGRGEDMALPLPQGLPLHLRRQLAQPRPRPQPHQLVHQTGRGCDDESGDLSREANGSKVIIRNAPWRQGDTREEGPVGRSSRRRTWGKEAASVGGVMASGACTVVSDGSEMMTVGMMKPRAALRVWIAMAQ